jgi:hypothetical protein
MSSKPKSLDEMLAKIERKCEGNPSGMVYGQANVRTLKLLAVIAKLREQRNNAMGDYTWDRFPKIEKGRLKFDQELALILEAP